jgi:hypothetical protein
MNTSNAQFSWKDAPDLMARLTTAQNHRRNWNVDVMTFAGMCDSREQLQAHVEYYEKRATVSA